MMKPRNIFQRRTARRQPPALSIEQIFHEQHGIALNPALRGSVKQLRDVPMWIVDRARQLQGDSQAYTLPEYYVADIGGQRVMAFMKLVVHGRMTTEEFGKNAP